MFASVPAEAIPPSRSALGLKLRKQNGAGRSQGALRSCRLKRRKRLSPRTLTLPKITQSCRVLRGRLVLELNLCQIPPIFPRAHSFRAVSAGSVSACRRRPTHSFGVSLCPVSESQGRNSHGECCREWTAVAGGTRHDRTRIWRRSSLLVGSGIADCKTRFLDLRDRHIRDERISCLCLWP